MAKDRHDVIIYLRSLLLEVVIPEKYVWEFMGEFGKAFAIQDSAGTKEIKAVEDYHEHPNGWHIRVSVWDRDEGRFYRFLRDFCAKRKLSFREPEAPPTA